jgi:cation:H+ antiporter
MAALFLVAGIALLVIGAAVACLPIFFTGQVVARWEGGLFLGYYYGAYVGYLFLAATQHDALPAFSTAMWTVVIPLTALTLLGASLREWWGEGH